MLSAKRSLYLVAALLLSIIAVQTVNTRVSGGATSLKVAHGTALSDTTLGLGTVVDAVDMLSPSFGYGIASATSMRSHRLYLVQTTNVGTAWTVDDVLPLPSINNGGPNTLLPIEFVTHDLGYVSSYEGSIYVTRDAGSTWRRVEIPGIWPTFHVVGSTLAVVSGVCHGAVRAYGPAKCPSYLSLFQLGSVTPYATHVVASVGRSPWRGAVLLAGTSPREFVVNQGEIDGPGPNTISLTTDAGASWHQVVNPCKQSPIGQLLVVSANDWLLYCFLDVGMGQGYSQLSRSMNDGVTWTTVSSASVMRPYTGSGIGDTNYNLTLSRNRRILFGALDNAGGGVWVSLDGGVAWLRPRVSMQSGGAPEYLSPFGPTGAIGGALGGALYRTNNATTWSEVPSLPAGRDSGSSICSNSKGLKVKAHYSYDQNGSWQYVVTFTNNGVKECYLNGSPVIQAVVGTNHRRVGPSDSEFVNGVGLPFIMVKAHGGVASLLLYVQSVGTTPAKECGARVIDAVSLNFNRPASFDIPIGRHVVCALTQIVVGGSMVAGPNGVAKSKAS